MAGFSAPRMSNVLLTCALAFTSSSLLGCGNSSSGGSQPDKTTSTTTTTTTTNTTTSTSQSTTASVTALAPCLCIFDIDRTLTGLQGETARCPANQIQAGVQDMAYSGGTLTLSDFTQRLDSTFCNTCYIGIITAGIASGPGSPERSVLHQKLSVVPGKLPTTDWADCGSPTAPLITSCRDGYKQDSVPHIVSWYQQHTGVRVADTDIYFFDDRVSNILPFQSTPYNARQISCATRDLADGSLGLCGATAAEIKMEKGVFVCQTGQEAPLRLPSVSNMLPV